MKTKDKIKNYVMLLIYIFLMLISIGGIIIFNILQLGTISNILVSVSCSVLASSIVAIIIEIINMAKIADMKKTIRSRYIIFLVNGFRSALSYLPRYCKKNLSKEKDISLWHCLMYSLDDCTYLDELKTSNFDAYIIELRKFNERNIEMLKFFHRVFADSENSELNLLSSSYFSEQEIDCLLMDPYYDYDGNFTSFEDTVCILKDIFESYYKNIPEIKEFLDQKAIFTNNNCIKRSAIKY